jgi:hypothetical protein
VAEAAHVIAARAALFEPSKGSIELFREVSHNVPKDDRANVFEEQPTTCRAVFATLTVVFSVLLLVEVPMYGDRLKQKVGKCLHKAMRPDHFDEDDQTHDPGGDVVLTVLFILGDFQEEYVQIQEYD